MQSETVDELARLARGDCYAAFKSAAVAIGLTPGEAEAFYSALDVDECGAGSTQLASSETVDLEDWR